MTNGQAVKRQTVTQFPAILPSVTGDQPAESPSWLKRRLYDLGVLAMANEPARPPGFFVNVTTLSIWIAIVASVLGGFWFMHQRIENDGYQRGILEEQKKQQDGKLLDLQRQIDKTAEDARRAAMLGASQAGHEEKKK
jgi:hypothetical protein